MLPREGLVLLNFDWISPLIAAARNSMQPTFVFAVSMDVIDGYELLNLLDSNGIKHWGEMIIHECWVVSVPKENESKVVRLLSKRGINLV